MRLVLTLIAIVAYGTIVAQDFLHLKTGEVIEVKIFSIDLETDFMGYELDNKKVHRAISSLKKYELNSTLSPEKPSAIETKTSTTDNTPKDFIYLKTGEVIEVKIFSINFQTDFMGYELDNKKMYRAISSLKKYELNSTLSREKISLIETKTSTTKNTSKEFDSNVGKYSYGKWSISTNLTSLFSTIERNSRFTIEPEYDFTSKFSVRVPIRIGVGDYYFYEDYTTSVYFEGYSVNEPPQVRRNYNDDYYIYEENVIFELAINPKFYPYGKHHRGLLSPYVGAALIAGIWKVQNESQNITVARGTSSGYEYWSIIEASAFKKQSNVPFMSSELTVGSDFTFSRTINLAVETGVTVNLAHGDLGEYSVFGRQSGGEYSVYETRASVLDRPVRGRFRILLTYRFNGQNN